MRKYDIKKIVRESSALTSMIDNHVQNSNYSNCKKYKRGICKETGKEGILMLLLGEWVWSWHNTIHTNYSCLLVIFNYISKNFEKKLQASDFEPYYINSTIRYIDNCLTVCRDYLFASNSDELIEMQFITQETWIIGKISELSSVHTLKSNGIITEYNITYERGLDDDIKKGQDYYIKLASGMSGFAQEKRDKNLFVQMDGQSYGFGDASYILKKYNPDNVSFIIFNNGSFIFPFRYDRSLMKKDKDNNEKLIIDKSLMLSNKPMKNTFINISEILTQMNEYCSSKHIQFTFKRGETNKIEDLMDEGERVIRVQLSDNDMENFDVTLSDFFEKVKTTL